VAEVAEPKVVRLGSREVPYLLKRSTQRRRIVLTVDEDGLCVGAPWRSSEKRVLEIIREAESWVLKKLDAWSALPKRRPRWTHGETIQYLGRDLVIDLVQDPLAQTAILQGDGRLQIRLPDTEAREAVRSAVVKWYRRHARTNFEARIAHLSPLLGVALPRLFLSSARTRWGSCNAQGHVRLNWRLIQAVQPTVDYVVVHELAHLLEMNHSKRFWNLVADACPHHKEARAELDRMGRYYMAI
jgi:predicted metal-dependent hydrolase